jgi:putative component of toxin-antitoxin plasmid stabilization module
MTHLRRDDGFGGQGDAFYERLVAAHRGLSDADSGALNARLVLLLANHVGDAAVVAEAIVEARRGLGAGRTGNEQER